MVKKKSKNTTLIIFLVIMIILVIAALLLYFFLFKENYKKNKWWRNRRKCLSKGGTWKRRQCIFRDTGKSTTTEIIDDHIPKNGFRQFTGIRGEDQKFRFIYNDDGYWKSEYWTDNWEDYSQDSITAKYDLISIENINTPYQKVFLKSQSSNRKAFLDGEKGIIRMGSETGWEKNILGLNQMKSSDYIMEEERIINCKWS
jgi:hypothetical protein